MSDDNYFKRLGDFWFPGWASFWWFLLALMPLYFLQTLVHEGSHALAAASATGDMPGIAPFPHATADGRFLNGVTFSGGGFIATPQFVALGLVLVAMALLIFWRLQNPTGRFVLRLLYLGFCIDLLYNTARELVGGHNRFADWSRFQDSAGISDGVMVFISLLIWLLVLSHFLWVYYSAWHQVTTEKPGFWDFRWVAFVLALVSLAAILCSALISDPGVVKGHAYFILPLILQILCFIWYVIYFIWSFSRDESA